MQPISIKDPVGTQIMSVDPTQTAGRVSLRPLEHIYGLQIGGHYRAILQSGATNSIAAAGILGSIRFASATLYSILMRLTMWAGVQTALTAVGNMNEVQAFVFRGSTGNASSGSTVTPSKIRVNMPASQAQDVRICGAGALTAASGKTNDSSAFCSGGLAFPTITVGSVAPKIDLYKWDGFGQHPEVFAPNEGIEIQNVAAGPTTGAVTYFFDLEWCEAFAF
jgi:hypothetical protein